MSRADRGGPDVLASAFAALLSAFAMALIVRASTSSNHWGLDVRPAWGLCAGAVLAAALGRSLLGKPARIALLASGALVGVLLGVLDRFNLLVEYGVWIRRGMPGPWEG